MDSYFIGKEYSIRRWLKAVAFGFGLWLTLIGGAVTLHLRHLRTLPVGGSTDITIGPLTCIHIDKTVVVGGGYGLNFTFLYGLFVVLALCLAVELGLVVLVRHHRL